MNRRTRSRLDAVRRAYAFSRQHQADIAGYVEAVRQVGEGLARADALAAQQEVGDHQAQASVARKTEKRRIIVQDHLAHIVRIARVSLPRDPELRKLFTVPAKHINRERFVAAVRATLAAAAERKALFITEGLPETFVEDLEAQLTAYLEANDDKSLQQSLRVGAVADLKAVTEGLFDLVRRLDGINRKRWAKDPEMLAAWLSAADVRTPHPHQSGSPPTQPLPGGEAPGATT